MMRIASCFWREEWRRVLSWASYTFTRVRVAWHIGYGCEVSDVLNLNIESCYRILKIGSERVLKMSRHAPITAMFSRKDAAVEIIALLLFPLIYWLKYYVHELGHALPAFLFGHEFRIDVVEQGFGMYEGHCHISSFPTPDPTVNFIILLSGGLIGGLFMSIFYVVLRRRFVSLAYLWIAISQFAYMVVESFQATMYPEFLMISLFIALAIFAHVFTSEYKKRTSV